MNGNVDKHSFDSERFTLKFLSIDDIAADILLTEELKNLIFFEINVASMS